MAPALHVKTGQWPRAVQVQELVDCKKAPEHGLDLSLGELQATESQEFPNLIISFRPQQEGLRANHLGHLVVIRFGQHASKSVMKVSRASFKHSGVIGVPMKSHNGHR